MGLNVLQDRDNLLVHIKEISCYCYPLPLRRFVEKTNQILTWHCPIGDNKLHIIYQSNGTKTTSSLKIDDLNSLPNTVRVLHSCSHEFIKHFSRLISTTFLGNFSTNLITDITFLRMVCTYRISGWVMFGKQT